MRFNYQNTPLMVGGRLYMSTGYGTVAALDAATGAVLWFDVPPRVEGEEPTRGAASRGVAYWTAGRPARIIAVSGHYLVALDPESGSRFDSFGDGGQVDLRQYEDFVVQSYTWRSPPLVVGDVIVVGTTARECPRAPAARRYPRLRRAHRPLWRPPGGASWAADLQAAVRAADGHRPQRGRDPVGRANGDGPWDHPAIAHLDLPPLGQPGRAAPLVTKTMVFLGEGRTAGVPLLPKYGGGRMFRAYDKATGEVIWEMELPGGTSGAPMTYMLDGRQFIVVAAGWHEMPGELIALALR